MKGVTAIYLGRIVDKKYFRTFIYGANGEKKLVNSWDEFEAAMESGIWFAARKDVVSKPIAKRKPKTKSKVIKEIEQPVDIPEDDEMVFEVTDENR
jgi:hypothetical protein